MIRKKLKQIKCLKSIVKKTRNIIEKYKRPLNRYVYNYYLKKNKNHIEKKEIITIGFIVQGCQYWATLKKIYEEFLKRNYVKLYIFVVPKDDYNTGIITNNYDNYFMDNYKNCIKVVNESGECIKLEKYNLDYLFYQRPYNYRLPKELRSYRMIKHTKCCYIPYGLNFAEKYVKMVTETDFFDTLYYIFADSEFIKSRYIKLHLNNYTSGLQHIEYFGYPKLSEYYLKNRNTNGTITWSPRFNIDDKSTFLKYKDQFIDISNHTNRDIVFRPHPLLKEELIGRGIINIGEWNLLLKELTCRNIEINIESPIEDVLHNTDILITDISSIIIEFLMTGRPIIYCDEGIKFNPVYEEIRELLYIAYDWNDVIRILYDLDRGIDTLKYRRIEFIRKKYSNCVNSSKMIVDAICADAKITNRGK